MELHLTRSEMRRRMMARLGQSTGEQALVLDQYNEFLRAAVEKVYLRCPWQQSLRESRVSVGIDQRFLNYPTNTDAGGVQQIGRWDATAQRYVPLRRGTIPVTLDDEPLVDIGEPDSVPGRGSPTRYELKTQIEIWPRPDQAYELKVDYLIQPNLEADGDVSVVDAEAAILLAMADAYDFQGDATLAGIQRAKAEERLRDLTAAQHPMTVIRRGGRRQGAPYDYEPNSGVWPSRREDQE